MLTRTRGDLVFDLLNYLVLTVVLLIVLYPLYFVVIASFSDPTAVNSGAMWLYPKSLVFDGYKKVFHYHEVWIGFRNTIFYTVVGTALNVMLTMAMAYTLSRKSFIGKKILNFYLLIPMFFGGGLIPTYLLVKQLGLYNTAAAMIILGAVNIFNTIIARTFIQTSLPEELYEAAQMDGCNHFYYFFKIVMPLSTTVIAVLTLYYGVEHWNDYFLPLIYLNDQHLFSLQLILRGILISSNVQADLVTGSEDVIRQQREVEQLKYALIVISTLPIVAVYPFLQRYFVKGVMIGSLKS